MQTQPLPAPICHRHPTFAVQTHDAMGLPPASPGQKKPTHSHQIGTMVLFCSGRVTASTLRSVA